MPRTVRCEIVHAGPERDDGRPPLLFVHGVRHAAWCWERWQAGLAERGWRSAAVSLRGHGGSDGSLRGATLRAYVDDVVAAAEGLGSAPVLVGHSMGGILVQRAVHRTPARGLALVAPAPAHSGLGFALTAARRNPRAILPVFLGRPIGFTRRDLLSDGVPDAEADAVVARLGGESALAQFQITAQRRPPPRAGCPVLVLATPDDRIIPPAYVARTAGFQGVPVNWYPGLQHDVILEPGGDTALAALGDWLDREVLGPGEAADAGPRRPLLLLTHAAGWSSQVARRAHNPEVAGSNPAPAIQQKACKTPCLAGLRRFSEPSQGPNRGLFPYTERDGFWGHSERARVRWTA